MAWSIDNGATIDNNGLVTFPINNGTTDVYYTITFTDGDCSCTKIVKVKPNPTPTPSCTCNEDLEKSFFVNPSSLVFDA